jgi:hypothetical protein
MLPPTSSKSSVLPTFGTTIASTTVPAPDISKFLGSKNTISLSGLGITLTHAQRASMSVRDKGRVYENTTSRMEPKFEMIDLSSDLTSDDFLQNNYDFIVQLARLQNRITAYCKGDIAPNHRCERRTR